VIKDDPTVPCLMRHLKQFRFSNVPLMCTSFENPGIDKQVWVDKDTTPDQKSIEDYLMRIITLKTEIFHVGVGNSSLAKKLCPQGARVFGITIHKEEILHADALEIPNYLVLLVNKYSADMKSISHKFDFIVDNNPSSYACCLFHFCCMLAAFKRLLRKGGTILTADPGMCWVPTHGNPNWALRPDDWALIASALGLSAHQVDDFVYSIGDARVPATWTRRLFRRRCT
jgi:hypothetical protein